MISWHMGCQTQRFSLPIYTIDPTGLQSQIYSHPQIHLRWSLALAQFHQHPWQMKSNCELGDWKAASQAERDLVISRDADPFTEPLHQRCGKPHWFLIHVLFDPQTRQWLYLPPRAKLNDYRNRLCAKETQKRTNHPRSHHEIEFLPDICENKLQRFPRKGEIMVNYYHYRQRTIWIEIAECMQVLHIRYMPCFQ